MAKKRPTGFVATCQCGVVVGAMDSKRTDQREAGKLLVDVLPALSLRLPRQAR